MLVLKLFGTASLEASGRLVTGRPAQGRRLALLAALALARGRPVTRDKLTALLWPESPAERARHQLSDSLYIVRAALGEDVVRSTSDELLLNLDAVQTDVGTFERLLDEGDLEPAVKLFVGPLLDGFHLADGSEFEHWLDGERARLGQLYAGALESLAETSERSGQFAAAACWWRRLAAHDPYSGRVASRLMRSLEASGDRAGALQHARVHAALLRDEFDAGPDPEVVAFAERLRLEPPARPAPEPAALRPMPPPSVEGGAISEAIPAAGKRPARRFPASAAFLLAATAVTLVISAMVTGRNAGNRVIPPAAVMAVVPFAPSAGDTGLARLGRDLVVTISQTLDGIGGIRTVDAQTVLAHEDDGRAYSREAAIDLGQRLGAGSVLHGSLVRVGKQVRADLGLFVSDTAPPLARASIMTPADSIASLTDSIVRIVLRQIWEGENAPSPSLDVALQTGSVEALRGFLAGERLAARGLWANAAEAYARTIRADSTFWLAYWRLAYARGWDGHPVDSAIVRVIETHHRELPDRERLMSDLVFLIGLGRDSLSRSLAQLQEVTRRFPNYWFGWLIYADELVHNGQLLGRGREEARAAVDRTLELNPRLISMWEHFMWLALLDSDTAATARGFTALRRLDAREDLAMSAGGWDELLGFRLIDALLRSDSLGVDSLWQLAIDHLGGRQDPTYGATVLMRHGFPAHQVRMSEQILKAGVPAGAENRHRSAIIRSLLVRGAWDSALVLLQGPWGSAWRDRDPRTAYRHAVVAAWLGALAPERAARLRPQSAPGDAIARADLAWLDGVLAAARRDGLGIAASRERVRHSGARHAGTLERSLAALGQGIEGNIREAGSDLAELEWERADGMLAADADHSFLVVINRVAAARWLLEAGDAAGADSLLRLVDGSYAVYPGATEAGRVAGLLALDRARIAERLGDSARAARYYRDFLQRYDLAPPAHRDEVDQAVNVVRR